MGFSLPLPTSEDIPEDLRALLALLERAAAQQQTYSRMPVSKMMWPDALLQYANEPLPGFSFGAALRPGNDVRIGAGFQRRF
jgi:hypothetical protein